MKKIKTMSFKKKKESLNRWYVPKPDTERTARNPLQCSTAELQAIQIHREWLKDANAQQEIQRGKWTKRWKNFTQNLNLPGFWRHESSDGKYTLSTIQDWNIKAISQIIILKLQNMKNKMFIAPREKRHYLQRNYS